VVRFVILCVREFQIVRMKSRFSLFCFEKLILILSFSCSFFCAFSFSLLFFSEDVFSRGISSSFAYLQDPS